MSSALPTPEELSLENSELPRRKDDVMREKRFGLVGELGWAATVCRSSSATGEATVSPGVRSEVCSGGGLCFCNAAVGGMFVTCLMNVAMAR